MKNLNEQNQDAHPAQVPAEATPAPDVDVQQVKLDQVVAMVRQEVDRRAPRNAPGATDVATNPTEPEVAPSAPIASQETLATEPVVDRRRPPLSMSTEEIMRRVREEVNRRRGVPPAEEDNAAQPLAEVRDNAVGLPGEHAGLPRRRSAVPPLPLKPEYSLHELLQFSDAEFVDTVYRVILRRPADREGRARYLGALRNGLASKTEVLGLIRFSQEGRHRGVHIDGLLLRFKLQRWRHLPVLGHCLGFAMAVFRLPRLSTRLQIIRSHAARNNQALERFIDLNNEAVGSRFDDVDRAIASLRSQFSRVEEAANAALARIDAVEESAGAFQAGSEKVRRELADKLAGTAAEITGVQVQLRSGLDEIHALGGSLRAQMDEYGHHHHDVVNHLGAHDAMLKNLSVEGQRVHHGALEIQRQLIALLDRNMSPMPTASGEQPATGAGDKVLAPQYVSFEDTFRGDREDIKQRVAPYLDTLAAAGLGPDSGRVLDLGCGRGEWLEVLAENGYTCRGVDSNSAMVADSGASGFDVVEADAVVYLRDQPEASIAAITAMHIVEHIPHNTLIRLLDEAWRVLIPGGVLILETPNPENLTVGSCLFYLDPTHRNPIPPALLQWTVKERGFDEAVIERLTAHRGSPAIAHVPDDAQGAAQVNQMIDWFTAAPDYAIVAKKPADGSKSGNVSTTDA